MNNHYDNDFRVVSQSVNGANSIVFGYDNDSLLASAGSLTITHSPLNGLITGTTLGSVSDTRTYNAFGESDSYIAQYGASNVAIFNYTRDKLGRITQKTETVSGVTNTFDYTYDVTGRLTDVSKNSAPISHYEFDDNGNRTLHNTTAGTYDDQDRLLSYGDYTYTYTANGELLSKTNTQTNETTSYVYDALGNLLSVTLPDNTFIEYVIDAQNRRIGKKVNGALIKGWLYQDGLNPVAELDGSGNIVSRFVYGSWPYCPDYMIKSGETYRIIQDHLGSPRVVLNANTGSVIQSLEYDEYGNVLSDSNPTFQPFGFAGGLYDMQTGLVRFGARDYDPHTGRWACKDPIRFDGGDSNLFQYCGSNPINLIDPFGLEWIYIQVKRAGGSLGAAGSGTSGWGHSWLTLVDNNGNTTSYGLWPKGGASPLGAVAGHEYVGLITNNSGSSDRGEKPDVSYPIYISTATYNDLITKINNFKQGNPVWSMSFNCTDFALMVGQLAGINFGDVTSFGWSDPNKLADWINKKSQNRICGER